MEGDTVKIEGVYVPVNALQQNSNDAALLSDAEQQSVFNDYIDLKQYETEDWKDIKPEENKGFLGLFGSNTYTYLTPDGSKINVTNCDNMQVKVNAKTGEIVIVGANQADITMAKNSSLTVIESTVKNINATEGGETINIQGAHTTVSKIKGAQGSQNVTIEKGASVERIDTGDGKDSVTLNSASAGKIDTGLDDDTVIINSSTVQGKINTKDGNDRVEISNDSRVEGKIKTGLFGNDTVDITDSTVSDNARIKTGFGQNIVNVTNSKIDGEIAASTINGGLEINADNSTIQNIKGVNSNSTVNSTNSAIKGVESAKDVTRDVTALDTSIGSEFEGYNKVEPKETKEVYIVQDVSGYQRIVDKNSYETNEFETIVLETSQSSYEINGATIWMDSDCGEIFANGNGDIVLNGANNANINSSGQINVTAISSNILNHKNIEGNVNYRNCVVDGVYIAQNTDSAVIVADKTNISTIEAANSSATISAQNSSNINEIKGASDKNDNVSIQMQNSCINDISLEGELSTVVVTCEGNTNSSIGKIETEAGLITTQTNGATISTIVTKDGSLDLTSQNGTIGNVENKNKDGVTNIDFDNTKIDIISSKAVCEINLKGCSINKKVVTSDKEDTISIIESEAAKIDAKGGLDNVDIKESDVEKLNVSGSTSVYASDIDKLNTSGDVAILNSEIDRLNSDSDNLYVKNSLVDDELLIDSDNSQENEAIQKIQEFDAQNIEEINALLSEYTPEEVEQIKEQLVLQMIGAIKTLEDSIEDDKSSLGAIGTIEYVFDNDEDELSSKKELLQAVFESDDLLTILNAYTLITDEAINAELIANTGNALKYASTLDSDNMAQIIQVLEFIGNDLEYQMTSQDGVIKELIAQLNMKWDIGTNRSEVIAYLDTYRQNVAQLKEKLASGELSDAEFAAEYKRLTGNDLTQNNVETLLDTSRGNDRFNNAVEEKIEDYQQTQQAVLQVGEYAITIVAGSTVTLVSGGAAGPAIAAALNTLGKMGIALTATTVSFITKTAIEATERHTNSVVADDMTPEEVATSAALMYAGCLCGQLGNAVGDYIRANGAEFFSKFISSQEMINIATKVAGKSLEIGSDTAASVITTAMITGSGSFDEEFMQNLRSEMIGLIQSKITGAYFKAHPELQINTQLYSARKALTGVAEAEANVRILKQFGFEDSDAVKLSALTSDEVDTIVLLKATNDLCEASLKSHGIDISKLSTEEKIEQGKIVDDLYANTDTIKQETSSTCSVVSVLNAIDNKPMLLQALVNKFEYDASSDMYKFNMFGQDFEVKLNDGDNLLQKAYEAYQITFGDTKTSAIDVFNGLLDGANDIIVRPSVDNIQTLKGYVEDEASILTFNTTDKIDGISSGHSYSVLSIDDMGNMRLQDPETLEEVTVLRSSYENKDCQIQGKTYKDSGLVEDGVELKLAAGKKFPKVTVQKDSELDIKIKALADEAYQYLSSENRSEDSLNEVLDVLGFSRGEITPNKDGIKTISSKDGASFEITARAKATDSIYSKLVKKLSKGEMAVPQDVKQALNEIGDAQGIRITMDNVKTDIPYTSEIKIDDLQTAQNKPFVDALIKAIQEDKLHVSEVENYCGENGIAYLTETNISDINKAYKAWFKAKLADVEAGNTADFTIGQNDKGEKILIEAKTGKEYTETMAVCETKYRDNGYTGTNISLVDSNGQNVELQLRGQYINKLAQIEHVIYDIKQEKETVSGEEYNEIRNVISKIYEIKDDKAKDYDKYQNPELAQAYDKYFADVYRANREIELGIRDENDIPKIEDYELLTKTFSEGELKLISAEGVKEQYERIHAKEELNKILYSNTESFENRITAAWLLKQELETTQYTKALDMIAHGICLKANRAGKYTNLDSFIKILNIDDKQAYLNILEMKKVLGYYQVSNNIDFAAALAKGDYEIINPKQAIDLLEKLGDISMLKDYIEADDTTMIKNLFALSEICKDNEAFSQYLIQLEMASAISPEISTKPVIEGDLKTLVERLNNSDLSVQTQLNIFQYMITKDSINNDVSKYYTKSKIETLYQLKQGRDRNVFTDNQLDEINETIKYLEKTLNSAIKPTEVSRDDAISMMKGFFKNNDSSLDNLLSSTDYSKFGKKGLPLAYSRSEFLDDLSNVLKNIPQAEQTEIFKKLAITPLTDTEGRLTGYDGIINLTKLSGDGIEKEVSALANKFIKQNSIQTGDVELDNALNSLIQGMPEFINVIGKQQNDTHDYSLDIHILTVLKEAMANPEYKNLSNQDKFCLKFACILHDIAKAEAIPDEGHAQICALYARDILDKSSITMSTEMKNRIQELVLNHHWLANYNTNITDEKTTAALFRRAGDITISRIMTEADLKGVQEGGQYYNRHSDALDTLKQAPVDEALAKINSKGQMFLVNKIIDTSKVPAVEYNDKTYKVIDFTKLDQDADLSQFGFEPGTTKENLRIFVHMRPGGDSDSMSDFETLIKLSDPRYNGFLSVSYISLKDSETYYGWKFGASIEGENANIANASSHNQHSNGRGNNKDLTTFIDILNEDTDNLVNRNAHRDLIPTAIKESLGLTDSEYSELYTKIQGYTHTSQLDNIEIITAGNKTFTGSQIKQAILDADELMMTESVQNEATIYSPKVNALVAKVNSIDEIPESLLDYSKKHNIPIYILGA